jgi:plastocyanin
MFVSLSAWSIEETYNKEQKLDIPYREQAIIVTKEGFYPNRLVAYKGEKVRFFVTAVGETTACFNIPAKNIYTSAHQGKIAEAETYFDKAGTYVFNCPNNSFTGRVMIIEKAADKEETMRRGLASDVIKVWQPKDTPSEWVQIKKDELKTLRGMSDVLDLDAKEGE